jgi:hypothetical protein
VGGPSGQLNGSYAQHFQIFPSVVPVPARLEDSFRVADEAAIFRNQVICVKIGAENRTGIIGKILHTSKAINVGSFH